MSNYILNNLPYYNNLSQTHNYNTSIQWHCAAAINVYVAYSDLFGKFASVLRVVENLKVEDGVVESKTKSYWVRRSQVRFGYFHRSVVRFLRLCHDVWYQTDIWMQITQQVQST